MSCFLVKDSTINCVVTCLGNEMPKDSVLKGLAMEYDINLSDSAWQQKLAQTMRKWNAEAFLARYSHLDLYQEEIDRLEASISFVSTSVSVAQVLKSLDCWLYQCTEGNIPDTAFYQFIQKIREYLNASDRISEDEYDSANWG